MDGFELNNFNSEVKDENKIYNISITTTITYSQQLISRSVAFPVNNNTTIIYYSDE